MKKKYLLLLCAVLSIGGRTLAQEHCYSDEVRKRLITAHPEILEKEAAYEQQIQAALKKIDYTHAARTTSTDESGNESFIYEIPIVVHMVHDYGAENLSDNSIFNDVADWNITYAKQNADTSDVIPPFKKWIGNPHIRLHLATVDPNGNPTKGITRHRSYLTFIGGEQSKVDDWAPTSYVNIWFINKMSGANQGAAAYAHLPPDVTFIPYYDGIISLYDYADLDKTINHEMGHVFNLLHPWGNTNAPAVACGDDNVDDTPPTMGHAEPGCQYALPSSNQNSTYDTACATNYFKIYSDITGHDSLVNYPDTTNAQNIMDYTYCSRMFTIGQVERMHTALNSDVAGRNNLWSATNLVITGVKDTAGNFLPRLDLKPVPEFAALKPGSSGTMDKMNYFTFANTSITLTNESWNDTITATQWNFTTGSPAAQTGTPTISTTTSFADAGWVDLTMVVTGNNSGVDSATFPHAIFVADATGTPGASIFQDFTSATNVDKWPTFNYYNNEFKWQLSSVGMYDNSSMEYTGFDTRIDPLHGTYPNTGTPLGDFDDLFSVPVDLSAYAGACSLNFDYSGASRSSVTASINDEMDIDYTTNKGVSWTNLVKLTKGALMNKGAMATAYTPASVTDWAHKAIDIPVAARTNYTTFRFRYKPSIGQDSTYSSGNNFFMDRITFAALPAAVGSVDMTNSDMTVVPNPTSGDAYVILKDADNTVTTIVVMDITGKVVYKTTQQITGNATNIAIPHTAIPVKGMYIVQANTGNKMFTQKLIVY